jgi:phenylpropionate dioxygenase-like ring-hydroxylating dioxygenase large terminal subunit
MFLAHKTSVPTNSFVVLDQYKRQKVLINQDGNFRLISNVCPHQHSLISAEDGKGNRTCPYHGWSFTFDGKPLGSGLTACKNESNLASEDVYEWNGLLFSIPVDFQIDVDFSSMQLVSQRIDLVQASPNIIMDLFLDVDHIPLVHKHVYDLIGIDDINVDWRFYKQGSVQTLEQGAQWIAVYPNTMIEWQKGALFITVALPLGEHSQVIVFKYADDHKDWSLNETVWETAWGQDKEQAERIVQFPNSNLEPQKKHFRDFLNGTN